MVGWHLARGTVSLNCGDGLGEDPKVATTGSVVTQDLHRQDNRDDDDDDDHDDDDGHYVGGGAGKGKIIEIPDISRHSATYITQCHIYHTVPLFGAIIFHRSLGPSLWASYKAHL